MTGPIIVGVDGSPTSQRAAHKARDLALRLDVALHVVSAHTDATIEHVNSGSDQWVVSGADNALYIAEQVVRGLRTPGLKISAGSAQGKPAEALIDYAEKAGAQLIVVGNQRMRGARRVLGSVANTVSHTAGCDVYIANTYVD